MSNLGSLLKDQFARIARKEIRQSVEPLRKANSAYRKEIAALKAQLKTLEKQVAGNSRTLRKASNAKAAAESKPAAGNSRLRFSAKGLATLRNKLGLSQGDFGTLAGVSAQSVFNWEHGIAVPRQPQLAAIAALRGLGKREAAARLQAAGITPAKPRRGRGSAR